MDSNLRIQRLEQIKSSPPCGSLNIFYMNERKQLPAYRIPLDLLIYNQYNGRIASLVKSFEKQHRQLDPASAEDGRRIEDFLLRSNLGRNKSTKEDLKKRGQLKFGIVTKDGVIIDGNRRAVLLSQIAREADMAPGYFEAIILDERLQDRPKEIMRLETTYQMGEDEKLGYNAIEKYLKVKDMMAQEFSHEDIAEMMSTKASEIKELEGIMGLMDGYLDALGYEGIYTRLDGTEGIFVDLYQYLSRYRSGSSATDWAYTEQDISDLENIYYDLIRARFSGDGKAYRNLGRPSKEGSFFCKEDVWKKFRDFHKENIDPVTQKEETIDEIRAKSPGEDLEVLLEHRDKDWTDSVLDKIKENFGVSQRRLDDINQKNEPLKLLNRARSTLDAIDTSAQAFWNDEIVERAVSDMNSLLWEFKQEIKRRRK